MANSLCFGSINSCKCPLRPGTVIGFSVQKLQQIGEGFKVSGLQSVHAIGKPKITKRQLIQAKATESNQRTKPNSIVCVDCDGNGKVLCSQCKGSGVNSVDHFNGQFKAGGLCWLCRGCLEVPAFAGCSLLYRSICGWDENKLSKLPSHLRIEVEIRAELSPLGRSLQFVDEMRRMSLHRRMALQRPKGYFMRELQRRRFCWWLYEHSG